MRWLSESPAAQGPQGELDIGCRRSRVLRPCPPVRLSHDWLERFLVHRIGDRRVLRLIGKWLKAGILEDGHLTVPDQGTPQGAVISPLLANVYLHYVLDLWAHQWRQRHGLRRSDHRALCR